MKQIVLMYHDIYRVSPSESGFQNSTAIKYKIRADKFEAQVSAIGDYLRVNGLPANIIDFTFDDGGVSFLSVAAPILEKYGFRGKFYISTAYIGNKGFLDVEQIRELRRRGHLVGSHSHSHPERMSAMKLNEIEDEWKISQMMLTEVLGETPEVASIPNGYSSNFVLNAMADAGITLIDTSTTTTHQSQYNESTVRGRYAITDDVTTEQVMQIIKSSFVRFKMALRWQVLNIAKAILGDTYLSLRKKLTK